MEVFDVAAPSVQRAKEAKLRRTAATGVDEVTWQEYEVDLRTRIASLHDRIHRGAYRAKPSKRVYIEKSDGSRRPLGISSLEDKIVQYLSLIHI